MLRLASGVFWALLEVTGAWTYMYMLTCYVVALRHVRRVVLLEISEKNQPSYMMLLTLRNLIGLKMIFVWKQLFCCPAPSILSPSVCVCVCVCVCFQSSNGLVDLSLMTITRPGVRIAAGYKKYSTSVSVCVCV